jgi:hypothetical protein
MASATVRALSTGLSRRGRGWPLHGRRAAAWGGTAGLNPTRPPTHLYLDSGPGAAGRSEPAGNAAQAISYQPRDTTWPGQRHLYLALTSVDSDSPKISATARMANEAATPAAIATSECRSSALVATNTAAPTPAAMA